MKDQGVETALEDLVAACAKAYGERMRDQLKYVVEGIHGPVLAREDADADDPIIFPRGAVAGVVEIGASNGRVPARKPKRGKWAPGSPGRVPAWYKAQQRKAGKR